MLYILQSYPKHQREVLGEVLGEVLHEVLGEVLKKLTR